MKLLLNNKKFNGKYQFIYFCILDINDWLGMPITFVIGEGNTFINFSINKSNWNKKSTKYKLLSFFKKGIKKNNE